MRLVLPARATRTLVLLGAALLLWPVAAAFAAPNAAQYQFTDPTQGLSFDGKAWGHGVGLCQWGARGRALAGQSAEQIVGTYYQGTTIQPAVAADMSIRVLVHSNLDLGGASGGDPPRITARGGDWQLISTSAATATGPADSAFELSMAGDGPHYAIKSSAGQVLGEGALRGTFVLHPNSPDTRFQVGYKRAGGVAGQPGKYYDTYRGELILTSNGDTWDTINRLSLQDYLRGVVPAEMPGSWPDQALKAQALAARSYAVWQSRGRAGERYDVDDTTRFQVYLGANIERPNVNAVVDATAGQVILSGGQVIQGVFFSTCAGWTENNEDVWGGTPLPYLRGIHDVDGGGKPYDADSPVFTWTTGAFTANQLENALNADASTQIGHLLSIDLSQRTASGRLKSVSVAGTLATRTIDATTLLTRFNKQRPSGVAQMLSTNFDLQWRTAADVAQTQGAVPTPGPPATASPSGGTPASTQPTPTPGAAPPPPATPTPAYQLEMTQPTQARPNGPTNQYYPETGHNVGGAFRTFYQEHGGLDMFGYPRTEEILEDGRTVQYFQRGRFEYHTENAGTPYEVQLMLIGDALTAPRRPFPPGQPFTTSADHQFFPETGHGVHYAFLKYFQSHGGLDVFGYPISEELYGENGWPYAVQYFQRARLEYHPELPSAYQVSLGLLGDQFLTQRLWLK